MGSPPSSRADESSSRQEAEPPRRLDDSTTRRLSLRSKIILYVLTLHLVLAAASAFLLLERPLLLFAVEAVFAVSIAISVRLIRGLFVPLDLIQTGAELIAERDFTSRF